MGGISQCSGDLDALQQSTFSEIRRNLDACCSYLIFELTVRSNETEDFKTVYVSLEEPGAGIQEKASFRDRETGHLILVAKLFPDYDQKWKDRMLSADLPDGMNFYFYGELIP